MTLERADLRDIFEVLVIDLIGVAAGSALPDLAIQQTLRRLEACRCGCGCASVVDAGAGGTAGRACRDGAGGGGDRLWPAVLAWSGWLGRIYDFQGAGMAIEVKATISISHHIGSRGWINWISRIQQLGPRAARINETAEGHSLPKVIGALRKACSGSSERSC